MAHKKKVKSNPFFEVDEGGKLCLLPLNFVEENKPLTRQRWNESLMNSNKKDNSTILPKKMVLQPLSFLGNQAKENKKPPTREKRVRQTLFADIENPMNIMQPPLKRSRMVEKIVNNAPLQNKVQKKVITSNGKKKKRSVVSRKLNLSPPKISTPIITSNTSSSFQTKSTKETNSKHLGLGTVISSGVETVDFLTNCKEKFSPGCIPFESPISERETFIGNVKDMNSIRCQINNILESQRDAFDTFKKAHEHNMNQLDILLRQLNDDNFSKMEANDIKNNIIKDQKSNSIRKPSLRSTTILKNMEIGKSPMIKTATKEAAKLYASFIQDQSCLLTPGTLTHTINTPNTGKFSKRILSSRVQKQCQLLQDTPSHL